MRKDEERVQSVFIPVATTSEANKRVHWMVRAKRMKQQKLVTEQALATVYRPSIVLPCVVRMVRHGVRTLDDDNVRGALKAVRDSIARWLGIDDADVHVRYQYDQERCKRADCGVWVTFYSRATVRETIEQEGE